MKKIFSIIIITGLIVIYLKTKQDEKIIPTKNTPFPTPPIQESKTLRKLQIKYNIPTTKIVKNKPSNKKIRRPKINWKMTDTIKYDQNYIYLPFEIKSEGAVIFNDILLPPKTKIKKSQKEYKMSKPKIWPRGVIPYTIDSNIPNLDLIKEAIEEVNSTGVITFTKRINESDYVRFKKGQENCYSNIGKVGGEQYIILAKGCKKGNILHELMHTLGFFHEQSRHDRDEHINIYWQNIEQKYWPQFKKIPPKFNQNLIVDFDYESIMLYGPTSFAKDPKYATISKVDETIYTANRSELSPLDIEKIQILYSE